MENTLEKTLERINDLLIEQGKTQASLCDYLGIRSDMYSRWKKGDSRSYMFDIGRIADFFGVSADYLLGRIDRNNSNTGGPTSLHHQHKGTISVQLREC